ncbi:MAG: protein kinase [Anaerolineae bacterium]
MTDDVALDNLISQQLDEYRLDALLGHGGMARVYRGFDVRLKRAAAIKVIDAPFQASQDYIIRFEREAQAIAQVKHPHIVGVYRYGEVDTLLYIAMEYIDGADLEAVLATYRADGETMPAAEASRLIRQVCLALDYAHSKGVIHRDIKPSNIMLDKDGNAILTDFGLALLDYQTRGEIFGTPHYIAPEQVVSSAGAVPQSDLYALGVILYEIFTGQMPFDAPTPLEVAMRHLSDPPPPPRQINPALSPALEAVILKALAKEAQERYDNGTALAEALEQALAGPNVEPQPGRVDSQARAPVPVAPETPLPRRPEAKKGKLMTPHYVLKNIRALLVEWTHSFSEAELRQLYLNLPDFAPVQPQLAASSGKGEIMERLLEYAEQTLQLDDLLALAREHNPHLYEKHQPYYEYASVGKKELLGLSLGKYHVVDRLGQGGMADVYKAYQPGLARYVAVKVIHGHLVDNDEFIERFEGEAMAVASLRHPNIVQVFDFDREDELYYMVMEFVDGPTLEAELKARKEQQEFYPLSETVTLFKALADAIDYAHSRGVIHRDLKPANIMFTPRRRVVLTDFGIARVAHGPRYTTTNAVIGTPAYMSPEQAQGERVDSRSDIYSLGVILYELVTGRIPFEGDNPIAIVLKLVNESWPHPTAVNPTLPPPVEQVILKAMRKNPDERYQSAGEMAIALQQAVELSVDPLQVQRLTLSPQGAGSVQPSTFNVERSTPEINIATPPPPGEMRAGGVINISGNSGQIGLGGQNLFQIGTISGGQVNIGPSRALPNESEAPKLADDLAAIRQRLAELQARVEAEAPPDKKAAALERLAELMEALSATPPDLDTLAYGRSWFAKNAPALSQALLHLLAGPEVARLMAAAGESVAAEFRRRFG